MKACATAPSDNWQLVFNVLTHYWWFGRWGQLLCVYVLWWCTLWCVVLKSSATCVLCVRWALFHCCIYTVCSMIMYIVVCCVQTINHVCAVCQVGAVSVEWGLQPAAAGRTAGYRSAHALQAGHRHGNLVRRLPGYPHYNYGKFTFVPVWSHFFFCSHVCSLISTKHCGNKWSFFTIWERL